MASRKRNRNLDSLRRRRPTRKAKELILIVTEGEKTEPVYFKALCQQEHLVTAQVRITPSDYGTDPLSVVDYALELQRRNRLENHREGEPLFDSIYCVIDRDDHTNFHDAFIKGRDNGLRMVRSIPCFEIWYLLHFWFTTRPFNERAKLFRELRKYLPNYQKGDSYFAELWIKTETALIHADRLYSAQAKVTDPDNEHPNPLTDVHRLVRHLLNQTH